LLNLNQVRNRYGGLDFGKIHSLGCGAVMLTIHLYTPDGRRAKAKKPGLTAQNQWRSGRLGLAERRMRIKPRQGSWYRSNASDVDGICGGVGARILWDC